MRQQNNHAGGDRFGEQEIKQAVERAFPAPEFREYQEMAAIEVVEAFANEGKSLVLLNAPTGSGKSLVLYTAVKALEYLDGHNSFFTTPLNSLVDQIDQDEFIDGDMMTLKGRNNYDCIHEEDMGTDVDKAICQRDSGFDCEIKGQCQYYGRKAKAAEFPHVATNNSFIMAEGMVDSSADGSLGFRDDLTVDECQSLEGFAMSFISFTISQNSVPEQVWQNISLPDEKYEDDMNHLINWLKADVLTAVREMANYLDSVAMLSEDQLSEKENLERFEARVENFLEDIEHNDWVAQIEHQIRKNRPNVNKVVFKPIVIGRFLQDLLWSRGENIILSSATIPGGGWLEEIGLEGLETKKLNVPSTFPVENRPIIMNESVGKMTKSERKNNAPDMARKIKELAEFHSGQKGFIHCRSYNLMEMIKSAFSDIGEYKWCVENCKFQDRYNREETLEAWIESDEQIFFSVAMDEGIDLDGSKAEWQVLAKTLYKHMGDKRVRYRVTVKGTCDDCGHEEEWWDDNIPYTCPSCGSQRFGGDWDWYNRHAAIQIQQAYGRAVRSRDDEAVFYILDESANGLIRRNAELFNGWFLEAIEDESIDPSRGR